jgi:hypothetical protein
MAKFKNEAAWAFPRAAIPTVSLQTYLASLISSAMKQHRGRGRGEESNIARTTGKECKLSSIALITNKSLLPHDRPAV